ncbi:hypothetical protein ABES02_16175 [Neobacillus pocheonensis]|uniref:hypothetical protein n=1 Tax=Neobacillus pocheonensis TaxID=363869 RepID=UPI003D2B72F9
MLKAKSEMVQELLYKLDSACEEYESQIKLLKEEIESLTIENNKLRELDNANSTDDILKSLFTYLLNNVPFTMLHTFLAVNIEDDTNNRLEIARKLMEQQQYEFVLNWCKHIISLQYSESVDVKKWSPVLIEVMNQIMDKDYEDIEERNNKYLSVLQFIHDLLFSEYHDVMFEYLEKFFNYFHELILDNNEPIIILKYIDCILDYNQKELFSKLMNDLVDEWPFLDANVSETEFTRLLFYAFLSDLDTELLDQAKEGTKFLRLNSPEMKLYNTFYKIINREIPLKIGLKTIEDLKSKQSIFDENHFNWILEKIHQLLTQMESNLMDIEKQREEALSQQNVKRTKHLYLITKTLMQKYQDPLDPLKKERVVLSLHKNKYDFMVRKEMFVDAMFSKNTGKYYVTDEMVSAIRKQAGSLWFDVRKSSSEKDFQENHPTLFKWPSTDISESKSPVGGTELRNNSDLKRLGYQITGLTRQERWGILSTKAVPQLGLKKVVHTIAFLVRGRKSMKNGLVRNRNSITEWEHDLAKIKQTYYKNEFGWPKT